MMDRETALDTLRLSANASHADIVAAFSRLARRYPLQQFAERHTRLLEAKSALLSPELAFKDMLFEENIDLNWLNRYTTGDGARLETATADEPSPRQCLEALFRPHLKNGFCAPSSGSQRTNGYDRHAIFPEKSISRANDDPQCSRYL
jgi:hypothetical protein